MTSLHKFAQTEMKLLNWNFPALLPFLKYFFDDFIFIAHTIYISFMRSIMSDIPIFFTSACGSGMSRLLFFYYQVSRANFLHRSGFFIDVFHSYFDDLNKMSISYCSTAVSLIEFLDYCRNTYILLLPIPALETCLIEVTFHNLAKSFSIFSDRFSCPGISLLFQAWMR